MPTEEELNAYLQVRNSEEEYDDAPYDVDDDMYEEDDLIDEEEDFDYDEIYEDDDDGFDDEEGSDWDLDRDLEGEEAYEDTF